MLRNPILHDPYFLGKLFFIGRLEPKDIGFDEIAEIFSKRLLKENDAQQVNSISIRRFQLSEGSKWRLPHSGSPILITELNVELSNNQVLEWRLEELNENVDKIKQQGVFRYALMLFGIGVFVHIAGIILHVNNTVASYATLILPIFAISSEMC